MIKPVGSETLQPLFIYDPDKLVRREDVDVFLDMTRGTDSHALVEEALRRRRPVATPNKSLIREHGAGLETLARIQHDEWSANENLRINTVVPGPINSPLRGKTHPGENTDALPAPESLTPLYLYLLGPDSRGVSGRTFSAQP